MSTLSNYKEEHSPKEEKSDADGVTTTANYSGTWTPEELDYVHGIIDEFEAGNTPDAEDGKSTLRCFIADKLECSEKRISKKFENTGYNGRQIYRARKTPMPSEESQSRLKNLAELERRFKESRLKLLWAQQAAREKLFAKKKTSKKANCQSGQKRKTEEAPGVEAETTAVWNEGGWTLQHPPQPQVSSNDRGGDILILKMLALRRQASMTQGLLAQAAASIQGHSNPIVQRRGEHVMAQLVCYPELSTLYAPPGLPSYVAMTSSPQPNLSNLGLTAASLRQFLFARYSSPLSQLPVSWEGHNTLLLSSLLAPLAWERAHRPAKSRSIN